MITTHPRSSCLLAISTLAAAFTVAPGSAEAEVPAIISYQASTQSIDQLQAVRLWWTVQNAARVDIVDGFRNTTYSNLGNDNYIEVWPERTATYTLVAYGANGEVTSSQLTIVVAPASIDFFNASPTEIYSIQPVHLSWRVHGASRVDVYDGFRNTTYSNLGNENYIEVWPERTATYTLNVYALDGHVVTQAVTIGVFLQPLINDFAANPSTVERFQVVSLSWNVQNVVRVEIRDQRNNIVYAQGGGSGSTTVQPGWTTTYTLYAFADQGPPAVRQVVVNVLRDGPPG